MKKQLLHTYRFVFLCMLIAVVGLCLVAGYSVRVLDQNQVIQQVDTNMEAAKVRLDRDAEASATMMEDLRNEYASKTRVVAMLLEELRVVIDADQISVSNETGILIASTDFSSTGKRAYRAFLSHTTDPVFTDVVFTMQNDKPMILAASALGSGKGLIQVQFLRLWQICHFPIWVFRRLLIPIPENMSAIRRWNAAEQTVTMMKIYFPEKKEKWICCGSINAI